jgi:hypothetical protein
MLRVGTAARAGGRLGHSTAPRLLSRTLLHGAVGARRVLQSAAEPSEPAPSSSLSELTNILKDEAEEVAVIDMRKPNGLAALLDRPDIIGGGTDVPLPPDEKYETKRVYFKNDTGEQAMAPGLNTLHHQPRPTDTSPRTQNPLQASTSRCSFTAFRSSPAGRPPSPPRGQQPVPALAPSGRIANISSRACCLRTR